MQTMLCQKRQKCSDIAILFIVPLIAAQTHVYCHTDNDEKNTNKTIDFKSAILK